MSIVLKVMFFFQGFFSEVLDNFFKTILDNLLDKLHFTQLNYYPSSTLSAKLLILAIYTTTIDFVAAYPKLIADGFKKLTEFEDKNGNLQFINLPLPSATPLSHRRLLISLCITSSTTLSLYEPTSRRF